jgi:uncharacterized SAM-binding protein YcdF (DUF218 family)
MDLIIVLGAQNDAQGRLSAMARARARGALEAYRRRAGSRLVVTGGYGHFNPAPLPHAHYMAAHLIEQGVDPDHILARVESAHTVEDAALTRPFVDAWAEAPPPCAVAGHEDALSTRSGHGHSDARNASAESGRAGSARLYRNAPTTIIVVTSDVHVPRARLIFEHFYHPARLVFVGTPDAVLPQRLRELHAHESEQIERIRRQGGVIYQGRLVRHRADGETG